MYFFLPPKVCPVLPILCGLFFFSFIISTYGNLPHSLRSSSNASSFLKPSFNSWEKCSLPHWCPHNTLALPLSGLITFCFELLLHCPFSPARWSVPMFYGSKEGAGTSRECSARSGKAHFWTSHTWEGKTATTKQLFWSLGLWPRMFCVTLCLVRGLLQFQEPHTQGCLGSCLSLMGNFHFLFISHTEKCRAL